jgi:hypothetical protein
MRRTAGQENKAYSTLYTLSMIRLSAGSSALSILYGTDSKGGFYRAFPVGVPVSSEHPVSGCSV